jgi:two-component system sensor histidine kinase/response regulator
VLSQVRVRLILLGTVPLVVLAVLLSIAGVVAGQARQAIGRLEHSDTVLERSQRLQVAVNRAESILRGYLLSGDLKALSAYRAVAAESPRDAATLVEAVTDNPDQFARARIMQRDSALRLAHQRGILALLAGGQRRAAISRIGWHPFLDRFVAESAIFDKAESHLKAQRTSRAQAMWANLLWLLVAGGIAGAALTLALIGFFGTNIARRLTALAGKAERIAAEEEPGARIGGTDEIALVDHAFHEMAEKIRTREAALLRYRMLSENALDSMFFFAPDGAILQANHAAVHTYGYSRDEFLKLRWSDLREPSPAGVIGKVRPPVGRFETVHRRKDGSTFPVEVSAERAVIDGQEVVLEIVRDITERREREDALKRYGLLVERAQDAIFFFRRDDARILETNDAAVAMYGYPKEQLLQLDGRELRAPDAGPANTHPAPEAPFSALYETVHRRADGREFPVEVAAQSAMIHGEHVVLAIVRDISERRASEEAVRRALDQALEASRSKSEFVATMSHEIRTPMNAIVGMSELLLETALDRAQREYALLLRESAESLLRIVNDILDFSKVEAGRLELEVSEFSPVALVESVSALLAPLAYAKRLTLMTFVDPAIPATLLADAGRLRQVLINLAGNAIKFTDIGNIVVSAELVSRTNGFFNIRFSVEDTGRGIASAVREKLFEPFRQGDASLTRRAGGTGLGLAISKRIVQTMGSEIEVNSEVGKGSTFAFTLTLPGVRGDGELPQQPVPNLRVLVASKDRPTRDILLRYLHCWQMQVQVCADGDTAYELAARAAGEERAYDVLVADLEHRSRETLLRRMRGDEPIAAMRIVLLAAFDDSDQGREAIALGFDAYLIKPLRQSQLYDCLTNAAAKRETPAAVQNVTQNGAHRPHLLIAEDNPINQRLALAQLEKLGYRADVVATGVEALSAAETRTYDLVLLDCQMPEMDGFEVTRAIRKREQRTGAHLPIVAMTANALAEDRALCLAAGMDDYLSKPVSLEALKPVLTRWLRPSYEGNESAQTLNLKRLGEIFRSQEAVVKFLDTAVPALERSVQRLARAQSDAERMDIVHQIKGSAGNIGADELAQAAKRYEHHLKSGEPNALTAHLASIEAATSRLTTFYETLSRTGSPIS